MHKHVVAHLRKMNRIKLNLDFLEFIKTGKFGFLKLGETKTEIENQCFPPEDWINGKSKQTSKIWRYGNIEFHFNERNKLNGIFTDYVSEISGGESISISNWWILSNNKGSPSLLSTIKELNSLNLNYTKTALNVGCIELKLSNGVYFSFDHPNENPSEEQNNWTMTVIGKK